MSKPFFIPLLLLLFLSPAFGQQAPDLRLSPADHPAAETAFAPSMDEEPPAAIDPGWYRRTGAKKGLSGDAETEQELRVAPDTAVLARGFFLPWQRLLAAEQEPSVQVSYDEIALLSATKPLLIIPSGALEGTARSTFFKASLAEYAQSGGVIFCLAQRTGADFSVLPVPEGQRLEAAGWSEDAGPFFRASTVRTDHALLSSVTRPAPSIETDGCLVDYPANAQVLLARADGAPTAVVYAVGKGWVVATTLFTDFSSLLGPVNAEETAILRNLLAWSRSAEKAPASRAVVAAQNTRVVRRNASPVPAAGRPDVTATAERNGNTLTLSLAVPPVKQLANRPVLIRTGGQERSVTLRNDTTVVTFELPVQGIGRRLSYALYKENGNAFARGTIPVPGAAPGPARERSCYHPGDTAAVDFRGMGNSEVTLSGMGFLDNMIVSDTGSISVPVPQDLPAGTYTMRWSREGTEGDKDENMFPLDLCGSSIEFAGAGMDMKRKDERVSATATLRIRSTRNISGRLTLLLRGPDGATVTAARPVLSLVPGLQTVPVPFVFTPGRSGIWELSYRFSTSLADGAGIPSGPVLLASGSTLFDVGSAAILGVADDNPLSYEPSGPAGITAALYGTGKAAVEVKVDRKRVSKERLNLNGIVHHHVDLPSLGPGGHEISVLMTNDGMNGLREHEFVYGLRLPDLAVKVRTSDPAATGGAAVMPLALTVRNQGKTASGPSRAGLFEGDPAKGGKQIAVFDVPALAANRQQTMTAPWPLAKMAGARTLVAVADIDNAVQESNKRNNAFAASVTVPAVVLFTQAEKKAFATDQEISFPVSVFNLTPRSLSGISLSAAVADPAGRNIASQNVPVPDLGPGREENVTPRFLLAAARPGAYRFAVSVPGKLRSPATTTFSVLPTLLLAGSLDGTAGTAAACRPFPVEYSVRNLGNVVPSSGAVRLEVLTATGEKPLVTKQFPLELSSARKASIDTTELTPGPYRVRLTASAGSAEYKLGREFTLAERFFSVRAPLTVKRIGAFPRVLVLLGRMDRVVEQAVSEAIVKQAFGQEDGYYKIVGSEEKFSTEAMTGLFNSFVLFEPDEMIKADVLRDLLGRGDGIVIIGAGGTVRTIAHDFGIRLDEGSPKQTAAMLRFTQDTGLGLSGTIPVNGKIIVPRKRGTTAAAVFAGSRQTAALIDISGKGKLLVMPFSFAHSAFEGGSSELYSLVLRKAAYFVAPDAEDGPALGFSVSSAAGPVNAKFRLTFSQESGILWSNPAGKAEGNSTTCAFRADREQKNLLYLFTPSPQPPVAEVFYECGGRYISQGKAE